MNKKWINGLVSVANKLDSMGAEDLADQLDKIAQEASSEMAPNEQFIQVFNDVRRVLGELGLDDESLGLALRAVNNLQSTKYSAPTTQYYAPEGTKSVFVPREALVTAEGYVQFFQELKNLEQQLAAAEGNDEEYRKLKAYYEEDEKSLRDKFNTLMQYKQNDPMLFSKLIDFIEYKLGKGSPVMLFEEKRK